MIDLFFEMLPQVHGAGHSDMGAVKGLEAFLIVAILLKYTAKIKQSYLKKHIWNGVLFGIICSLFFGGFLQWISGFIGNLKTTAKLWESIAGFVAVGLVITFLTELTSNTATSTIILPVMGAAAVVAGFHPLMFMLPATLSASFAFMLPVATPPNAIVFGSGWVTIPAMSRAGFALNLIGAVLVTTLALLLIQALFL